MDWGQAAQHEPDHGEADEGGGLAGVALVVAGEAAATADPGQGPLDDPALGQDHEAVSVAAADDLQLPRPGSGDGGLHFRALIAGVADDPLDEGEAPPGLAQQPLGTVAILDAGRMDNHRQQQAECVGQDMALAAEDLLAGIVAGRIKRSPPLTAPLAVWLSMIAVVGLASRPACSRTST
jgi:hypothetical protein